MNTQAPNQHHVTPGHKTSCGGCPAGGCGSGGGCACGYRAGQQTERLFVASGPPPVQQAAPAPPVQQAAPVFDLTRTPATPPPTPYPSMTTLLPGPMVAQANQSAPNLSLLAGAGGRYPACAQDRVLVVGAEDDLVDATPSATPAGPGRVLVMGAGETLVEAAAPAPPAPDYATAPVLTVDSAPMVAQANQIPPNLSLLAGSPRRGLGAEPPRVPASLVCDHLFDPDSGTHKDAGFAVRAACAALAAGKDATAMCDLLGREELLSSYTDECRQAVEAVAAREFDFNPPDEDVLPGQDAPWRNAEAADVDALARILPYTSEIYRAMFPARTRECEASAHRVHQRVQRGGAGGIPCFPYTVGMKRSGIAPPVHFWGFLPSGYRLFFASSATWTTREAIEYATGIRPAAGDYIQTLQPYPWYMNRHPNGFIFLYLLRLTNPGQGDPSWGHERDRLRVPKPDLVRVAPGTPLPSDWRIPRLLEPEADGGGGGGGGGAPTKAGGGGGAPTKAGGGGGAALLLAAGGLALLSQMG